MRRKDREILDLDKIESIIPWDTFVGIIDMK